MSRTTNRLVLTALIALTGWTATAACAHGGKLAPAQGPVKAEPADMALAHAATRYLTQNRLKSGLVSSVAGFPATTMWDVGNQLAGMVAAHELGLLPSATFDPWMSQVLGQLGRLRLYRQELPNKAYNAETLLPVDYGALAPAKEIGFSAIDLSRLTRWLAIVAQRYPAHAKAAKAVTARWKTQRLVRDGALMGTEVRNGKESWNHEGRLGYEQYAAFGLAAIGVQAPESQSAEAHVSWVEVSGVKVPADPRDFANSGAHNYVTSEPYVLDGLETGFRSLPVAYANAVLQAQEARHRQTGILTTWSEDQLDRAPYFVYNCLWVDGQAWATLDSAGKPAPAMRGSSLKAATGWHMLYRTPYTQKAYHALRGLQDPARGAYVGSYEALPTPNKALSLNTNAIVLEALLYGHVGQPLEAWAASGGRR
ncbi:hypothetical protein D3C72_635380 [compost metagenome]